MQLEDAGRSNKRLDDMTSKDYENMKREYEDRNSCKRGQAHSGAELH